MAEKSKSKEIVTVMAAVLCALAFCLYIPAISFLSNSGSFSFGLESLVRGMAPAFIGASVVLAILFVNMNLLLFARRNIGVMKLGSNVSPLHVAVVLLLLCLWMEGFLLNQGLPQLTGEPDLFTSGRRLFMDSLAWLAVFAAGLFFWRRIAGNILAFFLFILLLMGATVVEAAIKSEPAARVDATSREVLDRAAFSSGENNVLVLLLDAMSTATVKEFLDAAPDAGKSLDGFVFFENNLQTATSTQWSIPSILKGDIFSGGSALEYQRDVFTVPASLPSRFFAAGYDVYSSSIIPVFNHIGLQSEKLRRAGGAPVKVPLKLYGLLLLRFAPYALKNPIANRAGFDTSVSLKTPDLPDGNLAAMPADRDSSFDATTYMALATAAGRKNSAAPTFHFHHVNGMHKPYMYNRDGGLLPQAERYTTRGLSEQATWSLRSVIRLLERLKSEGLYDSMTIALLGDHGDRTPDPSRKYDSYAEFAALLVKPAGSRGPLETSPAPTSNKYLGEFLTGIALKGRRLDELAAGLPEQRMYSSTADSMTYVWEGDDVTRLRLAAKQPVAQSFAPVTLRIGTTYAMSDLDERIPTAYPSKTRNFNLENGWGMRAIEADAEASFRVRARPGEKLDLTILWTTGSLMGGAKPFEPYTLTIRDLVSGREFVNSMEQYEQELLLPGFVVSDDSAVDFSASISPFLYPKELQYLSATIRVDRHKEK